MADSPLRASFDVAHVPSKTTLLESRWPKLALPRAPLLAGPTPLELNDALSRAAGGEIWIKRDDLTHPTYGGNKVRKLERLLGDAVAEGANTIVTTGAAGSHHVLATTLFGKRLGLAVHGLLVPQAASEHVTLDLRAMLGLGAEITPVSYFSAVPAATAALVTKLRLSGKKPYVIPPGGSNGIGALGYVEAGLELAQQMLEMRMPEPDAIVVPLGSGGTVAGLAVGLAAAGCLVPIHAIRVTPRGFVGRALLLAQIRSAIERLRLSDDRFPRISGVATDLYTIDDAELGEGYGIPTPDARAAMRLAESHDLHLDPTYTGKTLSAVLRLLREGTTKSGKRIQRVVYVHTLSSAPLRPLAEKSPSIPHRLDKLLT